ncbi:hypothetical protein [Hyphomicrobium album]|nr:hypothetical protein [Hyphomicrobium album]
MSFPRLFGGFFGAASILAFVATVGFLGPPLVFYIREWSQWWFP